MQRLRQSWSQCENIMLLIWWLLKNIKLPHTQNKHNQLFINDFYFLKQTELNNLIMNFISNTVVSGLFNHAEITRQIT